MADFQTLARPYAQAAFRQAQTESLDHWSSALARLATAVRDPQVATLVGNPGVSQQDLVALLVNAAGESSGSLENFLRLLAEYRRVPLLPEIAEQFAALRATAESRLDAVVTAAMPVDDKQAAALKAALEAKLNRAVSLSFAEDPNLIGGVVIQMGDVVIDGSVRGELSRLSAQLS